MSSSAFDRFERWRETTAKQELQRPRRLSTPNLGASLSRPSCRSADSASPPSSASVAPHNQLTTTPETTQPQHSSSTQHKTQLSTLFLPTAPPLVALSASSRARSMSRSSVHDVAKESAAGPSTSSARPQQPRAPAPVERIVRKRGERVTTTTTGKVRRSPVSRSQERMPSSARPSQSAGAKAQARSLSQTKATPLPSPNSSDPAQQSIATVNVGPTLAALAASPLIAPGSDQPPPRARPPRPTRSPHRSPIKSACFAHLSSSQTAVPASAAMSSDSSSLATGSSETWFAEPTANYSQSPSTSTESPNRLAKSPILSLLQEDSYIISYEPGSAHPQSEGTPSGWSALPFAPLRGESATEEVAVNVVEPEADADEAEDWARQRRLSSLMAGLGIVLGTTMASTAVALADEAEAEAEEGSNSSGPVTPESVEGPRRGSGGGGLFEELRFTSEEELLAPSIVSSSRRTSEDRASETFESADEGDEGTWTGQRRRLSRKVSNLPTIHDTSPNQDQPGEFEGDSVELPDEPIAVSFGYALDGSRSDSGPSSAGGDLLELDGETVSPTSVKQLVRESWRLSQMSDRDFTALDDKRLSVRATERNDDGLGLSLEMFDEAQTRNGAQSLYTPSARPPIARNPTSTDTIQLDTSLAPPAREFPFPGPPASLPASSSEPHALSGMLEVISPTISPVSPPLVAAASPAVLRVKTSFGDLRKPRSRHSTPNSPTRSQLTSPALEAHTARTSASSTKSPKVIEPESPNGGIVRSPSGMTRSPSGSVRRKLSLREPRSRENSGSDTGSSATNAAVKQVKRLSSLFSMGRSASKDDIALAARAVSVDIAETKSTRRRAATEMIHKVTGTSGNTTSPSFANHTFPTTPARSPKSRSTKLSPSSQQVSPFDSIPENFQAPEPSSPPQPSPPSQTPSLASSVIGSGPSSRRSSMASSHASLDLQIPVRAGSMLPQNGPAIPPRRGQDEQEILLEPPVSAKSNAPPLTASPFMARTWRSTLDPAEYESLKNQHGPVEMRRQEVIWELCETERSFVTGLRGVIRVFTLPLRTSQGSWIAGVPVPVSRLLDWLDDIVYLHSQISQALEQVRDDAHPGLVQRIATAFLPFVAKLEVHQPYLVRFDTVTKSIDEMTADPDSDFGEFVRMQSALPECANLSLSSFLLKPVQRLMKYPLFFKQLCELTPPTHPDHLAILSLLHSTDSIIRVMQEVKTREDEYEEAKLLQSRLKNLPDGFQLAVRDRRLVAHGQLKRVHISDRDRAALEMDALARSGQTTVSTAATSRKTKAESKDGRPVSAGGVRPSIEKKHSFTSAFRDDNGIARFSPQFSSPNLSSQLQLSSPQIGPVRRVVKTKAKESFVHVFVFSDLVLLATKTGEGGTSTPALGVAARFARPSANRTNSTSSTNKRGSTGSEIGPQYKVLETFGVSRVLGVSDLSGKTEHDHLIEVDLLPLTAETTNNGLAPSSAAQPTSIFLTLPERSPLSPSLSPRLDSPLKERHRWVEAFERSHMFALRSLSFPGTILNSFTAPITQTEWLGATASTIAGRPKGFPRSPSEMRVMATDAGTTTHTNSTVSTPGSIISLNTFAAFEKKIDTARAKDGPRRPSLMGTPASLNELAQQEREERSWWSVRLRQVTKEMEALQIGGGGGWVKTPTQEDGRATTPTAEPKSSKSGAIAAFGGRGGKSRSRSATISAVDAKAVEGLGILT